VVNKLFIFMVVLSSFVWAEGIMPANQWACRLECSDPPQDYNSLTAGGAELGKANLKVKAQKRLVGGAHVVEQCRSTPGYENCYLVSKDSVLPETHHFEPEASTFKLQSYRPH